MSKKDKDAYWFRHDSSAGRGLKIRTMQAKYTHWGKGIFWDIVEVLRDQQGYIYEYSSEAMEVLRELIACPVEVVIKINGIERTLTFKGLMAECFSIGLFQMIGKDFNCPPLTNNMIKWDSTKSNGSKGGRPTSEEKPKPTAEPKPKASKKIVVANYFAHPLLNDAYKNWMQFQKEKKKTLPQTTIDSQIKKLSKYPVNIAIKAIQNSIDNNYTGLFPESVKASTIVSPINHTTNDKQNDNNGFGSDAVVLA